MGPTVLLQLVYIHNAINVLSFRSAAAVPLSCACILTSSPKSSVLAMVKDELLVPMSRNGDLNRNTSKVVGVWELGWGSALSSS